MLFVLKIKKISKKQLTLIRNTIVIKILTFYTVEFLRILLKQNHIKISKELFCNKIL